MSRFERWSRRKLSNETTDDSNDVVVGEGIEAERVDGQDEPSVASSQSETEALKEESSSVEPAPGSLDDTLPDPDSLPLGSDIKAFLEPGVSQGLRRRALRRLFAGDNYGIRDGLDDYDDDYREKLKPLASELAQRMRQWKRPVEPAEHDEGVDEALTETPKDSVPASLEDAVADQESDETRHSASSFAEADSEGAEDVEDQVSSATLDEGRVGCRHQFDQD